MEVEAREGSDKSWSERGFSSDEHNIGGEATTLRPPLRPHPTNLEYLATSSVSRMRAHRLLVKTITSSALSVMFMAAMFKILLGFAVF